MHLTSRVHVIMGAAANKMVAEEYPYASQNALPKALLVPFHEDKFIEKAYPNMQLAPTKDT